MASFVERQGGLECEDSQASRLSSQELESFQRLVRGIFREADIVTLWNRDSTCQIEEVVDEFLGEKLPNCLEKCRGLSARHWAARMRRLDETPPRGTRRFGPSLPGTLQVELEHDCWDRFVFGYLRAAVHNHAYDHFKVWVRHQRAMQIAREDSAHSGDRPTPEQIAIKRYQIKLCLSRLSRKEQEVARPRLVEDKTFEEIAGALSIKPSAVKKRFARCVPKLAQCMRRQRLVLTSHRNGRRSK